MRPDEAARGLALVGRRVSVCDPGGRVTGVFTGVLRPLRYKNKMYVKPEPTPIGADDQGYHLLYAPPGTVLPSPGAGYLTDGALRYTVARQERVLFGSAELYVWAILREYAEV